MRANGFQMRAQYVADELPMKRQLGVPQPKTGTLAENRMSVV